MLWSTLFCLKGFDTALRFIVINIAMLLLTFLSSVIFYQNLFSLIATVGFAVIAGCANYRRLRAVKGSRLTAMISPLLLILIALMQLIGVSPWLSGAFAFGIAVFVVLVGLKPNKVKIKGFVQGYYGPKLAEHMKAQNRDHRQDPFIGVDNQSLDQNSSSSCDGVQASEHFSVDDSVQMPFEQTVSSLGQQSHAGYDDFLMNPHHVETTYFAKQWQNILAWCQGRKRLLIIVVGTCLAVVILVVIGYVASQSGKQTSSETTQKITKKQAEPLDVKRVSVKVPDGFWVIKETNVLIIRWLGDDGQAGNLWQLATAKGEQSCQAMTFNNQNSYRPLTVDLMADTGTEARFSPLDSHAIVTDIAMRGSFTLCGYKFNLKGSQAALMSQPEFAKEL